MLTRFDKYGNVIQLSDECRFQKRQLKKKLKNMKKVVDKVETECYTTKVAVENRYQRHEP